MNELDSPIRGMRPALLAATGAALVLAIIGSFTGGTLGTTTAGLSVTVIVAVPLLRVAVVGAHCWRVGDRRFTAVAALLIAMVGAGAIIALL
jgi:hypothetical protein